MQSDSLDPDQDLQSGSKLVTWYGVCCNIRGGGDYVLVVKFSRGDYVLVVKFSGGDYVLGVKFMGGDFVHVYKNEQGGFCPGGIMSVSPTCTDASLHVRTTVETLELICIIYLDSNKRRRVSVCAAQLLLQASPPPHPH